MVPLHSSFYFRPATSLWLPKATSAACTRGLATPPGHFGDILCQSDLLEQGLPARSCRQGFGYELHSGVHTHSAHLHPIGCL